MAEKGYRLKLETAKEVSLRANVPRLSLPLVGNPSEKQGVIPDKLE
ncbi:MAG: hypothetical protein Q8N12_04060 [Thermodesulfovibrionales bacterium]|nr:hypothetical protein [Nitrospinota bacterium]MDP3048592.1 hypothetical protein [Thermodesulfovibrionales bacterium]